MEQDMEVLKATAFHMGRHTAGGRRPTTRCRRWPIRASGEFLSWSIRDFIRAERVGVS